MDVYIISGLEFLRIYVSWNKILWFISSNISLIRCLCLFKNSCSLVYTVHSITAKFKIYPEGNNYVFGDLSNFPRHMVQNVPQIPQYLLQYTYSGGF